MFEIDIEEYTRLRIKFSIVVSQWQGFAFGIIKTDNAPFMMIYYIVLCISITDSTKLYWIVHESFSVLIGCFVIMRGNRIRGVEKIRNSIVCPFSVIQCN